MNPGAFPNRETNQPGLTGLDGIHRTDFITGPAIGTDVLVDHMNIFPLAYRLNGTNFDTGTTVDTVIVDKMISHFFLLVSFWGCSFLLR
jgi:hypothetical protein